MRVTPELLRSVDKLDVVVGSMLKGDLPGHEFHGNQWEGGSGGSNEGTGDSTSAASSANSPERITNGKSPLSNKDADKWGGDRGKIASYAVTDIERNGSVGIAIKDTDGRVTAIASCKVEPRSIYLQCLATKESGLGKKMMEEVCRLAKEKGVGVYLSSLESAEGFYKKMGMKRVPGKPPSVLKYKFTAEQAAAFAGNTKAVKQDDLSQYEPDNGAFTMHIPPGNEE